MGTVSAGTIVYEVDMDTARLLQGRRDVDAVLNGLSGSMGRLETSVTRTERSISSMQGAMSRLSGIAGAVMAALSVRQVAEYADAWVTLNNKLANALRPNEQLAEVTERVFNISQKTMSSLDATATLYARLERATRTAGTSTADLIKLTETINKGLIVSGATTQEASSTMIQLSQALASGVLRGEEFNSISENGSRLAVALAQSLGVTIGQLRGMAAQGKLTTDVVVKGLLSQGDQIAKEFSNTAMTLGQAFNIATNNVTKFVGESSTIKSIYTVSSKSIVSLSENIDVLASVVTVLAGVMGSRFVAAMTMAAASQMKATLASMASAKAAAESATAAEIEAAAKLRSAEADKGAAISALNLAQVRMNVLKVTNAESVAEVQLAEAQAAQIRTQLAQIESEKALEVQRLKSQITAQGRIATATRMAELQQAQAALNARLATAEAMSHEARAAAIKGAEAQVSAARLATADATGVATAANARYIVSQEASIVAAKAASTSLGLLRTGLNLLGGPVGAAMLAGAAIYYFWQKAQQARQESIDFADKLDGVIAKMKEMSQIQLKGAMADTAKSISAQRSKIDDLNDSVKESQAEYNKYIGLANQFGVSQDKNNGYVIKAANAELTLTQRRRDLDNAIYKLNITLGQQGKMQDELNQKARDSDAAFDILADNLRNKIPGASEAAITAMALTIQTLDNLNNKSNSKDSGDSERTKAAQKLIKTSERRLALSKLEGESRARLQAEYDAEDAGIEKGDKIIGVLQDQAAETERNTTERKKQNKEDKTFATQQENIAQKLANLKQQSEMAADSTRELSREQTILSAQQSLGKGASQEQIALAGKYAAEKWDTANALKAQAAAEKLLPEAKENASYKQDLIDLKTAFDAKKITQEQYNETAERLETNHQLALAKIRSQQAVSPRQTAAAEVDPVQRLANQHAQELALIQQFEQQGVLNHENALALKNAADTQYEKQRVAAQWEIYRNQSQANELLAASIDGFQSGAANAITGLINGTQSLQEAFANIGTTILGSVVSSLVEMGMQWVKSQMMGQAAAAASLASTMAQATAAAAAWAPAAVSASIATMGSAAAVGQTAYAGSLLSAKGLAVAGAREHGGPVSANSMYRVGEGGKPEIFKASNGSQYMIPGDNGSVISNRDMQGGGGGSSVVQHISFEINTTGGIDQATLKQMEGMMKKVALFQINDQANRPNGMIQPRRK